MNTHVKMDAPQPRLLDETAQGVIGRPLTRRDGPEKVSGRALYAAEDNPPGLATGVLVRATITHGRVTGLDAEGARAMPGVIAVLGSDRFLRNPAQGGAGAAPVQREGGRVDYLGQPIALVVAETFEEARHAAQSLRVEYEEEPAIVDPLSPDAPAERPEGKQIDQGDLDAAMAEADVVVDRTYTTPVESSAAMEPHASLAWWEGDHLTVRGSYQMLKFNRAELADALGLDLAQVRVLSPFVGGGFGSKLGLAPEAVAAAIAAREIGRPVRVALTRQQVFEATMRRTETVQRVILAADASGTITGLAHEATVSNLPGESFSEPVAQATHYLYGGGSRRYIHEIRRVHRTCAGSVRAPGEAVGMLALENAVDELAEALGMDPVALRLRNIPERDPETGNPFSARSFAECLTRGAERFGWSARRAPGARREGEWLVGLGMSAAVRTNILSESKARVTLLPDGGALVETDMTDIGTGTYTILGQIAGEMLGLDPARVEVRLGDTDYPEASGSGGSWGASSSGSSVYLACRSLRGALAERLGCEAGELTLKDGTATGANRRAPLTELLDGRPIEAEGHLEPGATMKEVRQASYGAHFAEVAVSAVTGEARVRRMLGVFAAGRILNERTARSQCEGGMVWGIGAALTEELVHDPRDGHVVNRDLAEYHIPVNLDVPQLDVTFVDERDDHASPIQSKGVGELGISGAGAAVTNAIYNACGVRVRDYPATLDKILAGLDEAA